MRIKRDSSRKPCCAGGKRNSYRFTIVIAFVTCLLFYGCKERIDDGVLSPKASLNAMELEAGFDIELIASEPLVIAPVAMTFDDRGRMWVVEMDGYMPDTLGKGEEAPVGRIVILEDRNDDGQMDERTVFLDSLVMPRAICLVNGGLLVAEPPSLWFYEIDADQPISKTLVDSVYADGGNVEHQPNGLLRALDNWIYSAKYDQRYRRLPDGTWRKEKTHFRGQWGISQDDWGRLYYNDNSSNLSGDYFPPGLGADNSNQRGVAGYGEVVVPDKRVYPIHPTTGVNRGYMDGILDSTGRLVSFTAACGPLVYRGGLFPGMNAFVAEPSANLIKRDVLDEAGYLVRGEQAYQGREFLASRDERFRPVNLYDGPDGSLYVLDMYRGIIQHSTYLTPYLKDQINQRRLTLPLGMGRIYRIFPKKTKRTWVDMPVRADSLVALLGHANGWVRDKAQQLLIDRRANDVTGDLRTLVQSGHNPLQVIHALWTLEGLGQLTIDDVQAVLKRSQWQLKAQALAALPTLVESVPQEELIGMVETAFAAGDTLLAPYAALAIMALTTTGHSTTAQITEQLVVNYANNRYVADALISGWEGREEQVAQIMIDQHVIDTASVLYRRLAAVITNIKGKEASHNQPQLAKRYPQGVALFQTTCLPCHGEDGRGVVPIAPPLAGSEWVTGDKTRLMTLVLYGLTGPIDVAGHTYKAPEVSGEMPGIVHNPAIDDVALAQLLSYIRNAWGNVAKDDVLPEELGTVRSRFGNRAKPFTQNELFELFGKK